MRRLAWLVLAVWGLLGVPAVPASAFAPAPPPAPSSTAGPAAPAANEPPPGQKLCTIEDNRVREVSGLVTLPDGGYVVANDSNVDRSAVRIFTLDASCKVKGTPVAYSPNSLDPEDLAVAPDGTIWSADIGDNPPLTGGSRARRTTVALWKLAPGTTRPVIHRVAYPPGDGPHDAEALLLTADGTPLIVTKELTGKPAGLYVPSGPLVPNTADGVKLQRVGEVAPEPTRTAGFFGRSVAITGGAVSPDGKRVALRTYTDAYEWDAPDGDVVKAITTGKPRVTPLPSEPAGEALAYSRDGTSFLTASDLADGPTTLLRYTPVVQASPSPNAPTTAGTVGSKDSRSFFERRTLQDYMNAVMALGVIGLMLVVAGIVGITKSRASRRAEAKLINARGVASVGTADDKVEAKSAKAGLAGATGLAGSPGLAGSVGMAAPPGGPPGSPPPGPAAARNGLPPNGSPHNGAPHNQAPHNRAPHNGAPPPSAPPTKSAPSRAQPPRAQPASAQPPRTQPPRTQPSSAPPPAAPAPTVARASAPPPAPYSAPPRVRGGGTVYGRPHTDQRPDQRDEQWTDQRGDSADGWTGDHDDVDPRSDYRRR